METSQQKNVLILCTGNSARSILSEAYINHVAGDKWKAYSAGSKPTGVVNPVALETLQKHGIAVTDARSKSWSEFETEDAPHMHLVITVCDNAANETCPVWPGAPTVYHWPFPDPAATPLDDPKVYDDFENVFTMIREKVDGFLASSNEFADPV
jgi:arsenate reductase